MEFKRRKYPHSNELSNASLDEWCEKQIRWLKASVETQKENLRGLKKYVTGTYKLINETNIEPANIRYMRNARKRYPILIDTKAVILCAAHIDRIGIAVMINCILYYDARQRGTNTVTFDDAKRLFWCNTSEGQWHKAWEDQKFINDDNGGCLDNLLDYLDIYGKKE